MPVGITPQLPGWGGGEQAFTSAFHHLHTDNPSLPCSHLSHLWTLIPSFTPCMPRWLWSWGTIVTYRKCPEPAWTVLVAIPHLLAVASMVLVVPTPPKLWGTLGVWM